MLTLLLIKILPERAARVVQLLADAMREANEMRRALHKKHRLGFDG